MANPKWRIHVCSPGLTADGGIDHHTLKQRYGEYHATRSETLTPAGFSRDLLEMRDVLLSQQAESTDPLLLVFNTHGTKPGGCLPGGTMPGEGGATPNYITPDVFLNGYLPESQKGGGISTFFGINEVLEGLKASKVTLLFAQCYGGDFAKAVRQFIRYSSQKKIKCRYCKKGAPTHSHVHRVLLDGTKLCTYDDALHYDLQAWLSSHGF